MDYGMKYLPLDDITYKTRLKEEEVIQRISDKIQPKRIRFNLFKVPVAACQGSFRDGSFKVITDNQSQQLFSS